MALSRVELAEPAQMTPRQRQVYELFPSNLVRGMLRTEPEIVEGYLRLGGSFTRSALDPALRELVILRVAALSGSAYERFQHLDRATAAGLSDAEIAVVEASDPAPLDQAKQVLLRYVDECVAEVKVSSPVFSARAALGDENLATVTLLIGHYMMTARFLETFEGRRLHHRLGWHRPLTARAVTAEEASPRRSDGCRIFPSDSRTS
jgi:alkylhydroperoxidase family enzyme